MGLLKHHGLLGTAVFLVAACTVQAAFVELKATVVYDAQGACQGAPSSGIPVQVSASPSSICTANTACPETPTASGLFTATVCSVTDGTVSGDFIETTLPYLFGPTPYVAVERYTSGQDCAVTELIAIDVYAADGKCHTTDASTSYRATRNADYSATVQLYTDAACTAAGTLLTVTTSQGISNTCFSDMKVFGAGVSPLYLSSTMIYDTAANSCMSGVPLLVTTGVVSVDSCTRSSSCVGTTTPYTGTACSSTLTYKNDMAVAFGSNAYVIVEKYNANQACATTELASITTYLVDGKCHTTGMTTSYTASRQADGSLTLKMYTDATCSSTSTLMTMTAAQVSGNSCTNDGNGVLDMKVFGSESTATTTTVYFSSIASYDATDNNCREMPTMLETSVVPMDSCMPTVSCAGSAAPYIGTTCSSSLTFAKDVATAFGSNPYVIVKNYNPGKACAEAELTGISTYLADGQCHRMSASTAYMAIRAVDGSSTILAYTNADCAGTSTVLLDASAAQVKGQSCANDANGVIDKKIYGAGVTAIYLEVTMSFDTNVGGCMAPVVPSLEVMSLVSSTGCIATSFCAGASSGPYKSITCRLFSTYQENVAKTFGSAPYAIVESYVSDMNCDGTKLSSVTVYTADGSCHKTGVSLSYTATRAADGSVTILTYSTSRCSGSAVATLDASAAQVMGQSCSADANGVLDKKIYGAGVTTLFLKSTLTFDTIVGSCTTPVIPTSVTTGVITSASVCTPSTGCSGSAVPYTSTTCSDTTTFRMDTTTLYGTKPYVMLELYTPGRQCAGTKLTGMMAYLADGRCHQTGFATSYTATRKVDGSTVIATYAKSTKCDGYSTILSLSATQIADNSCIYDEIHDMKVFGSGVYLASTVTYDTKLGGCKAPAVPAQLLTTVVGDDACKASSSCFGSISPYNGTLCSSTSRYQKDVAAVFGTNPYVIVEKYAAGKNCDMAELANIKTYIADTKCHRTSSSTSFRAIRKADGSATVMTYANSGSCSRGPSTFVVTSDQATGNSCAKGATGVLDTKLYGGGATPLFLFVTAIYDTNAYNCMAPAHPVQWVATTVSVDSCVPSTGCRYSGASYTSGVCSSTRTYHNDVAAAFGTYYVTVESYIAGEGCAQSSLASVTTYLADNSCYNSNPTASFRATTSMDGSAEIHMFMTSSNCISDKWTLVVPSDQVGGNKCINTGVSDVKVYTSTANWY